MLVYFVLFLIFLISMSDFTTSAKPVLSLHYFPVLARGLGPTLCMEFSGIPYTGNADSEKIDYKTISPFGQNRAKLAH